MLEHSPQGGDLAVGGRIVDPGRFRSALGTVDALRERGADRGRIDAGGDQLGAQAAFGDVGLGELGE
ncbi:hypothetical protein LRS58_20605 [Rhodococcus sp. BH2-1]|nr:hypothetical protein [Rhodococcus sp. BH2-1]